MQRLFKRLLSITPIILLSLAFIAPITPAQADGNPCPTETSAGCTNGLPSGQYQQLLADMQAHPSPEVAQIAPDMPDVHGFSFLKVMPATSIYDEPNGSVIGQIPDGFNFVIIHGLKDGFAQLRDGTWVQRSSLRQTYASAFSGVTISGSLRYPMAWVVQASIPFSFPGGVNNIKTPAIAKYTRVNIFATVHVGDWDWYLVGPGQWLEQRKVARLIPASRPSGISGKWVNVNLFEQVLTAYQDDQLIFATLISSGLPGWDTNEGTFKVWNRVAATAMTGAMGEPGEYSLPAVPFVMFFDHDISLHGTYWHDGFGFRHSHGCVNMSISDAKWVYDWMGTDDLNVNVVSGK